MKRAAILRLVVGLFFLGLLLTPIVIRRVSARGKGVQSTTLDARTSIARHGFYMQEISHAAGIDFVHQAPVLDPKLNSIMPEVASMGASVSIVDFDRDAGRISMSPTVLMGRRIGCIAINMTGRSAM